VEEERGYILEIREETLHFFYEILVRKKWLVI
jgi:hypothetical protein